MWAIEQRALRWSSQKYEMVSLEPGAVEGRLASPGQLHSCNLQIAFEAGFVCPYLTLLLLYIKRLWRDELQQHFRALCPRWRDSSSWKEQLEEEGLESRRLNQLNWSLQNLEISTSLLKYHAMGLKTESALYSTKLKGLSV